MGIVVLALFLWKIAPVLVLAFAGVVIAFSQSPQLALYAAMVYLGVQFVEGHVVMPLAQKWAVAMRPALALLGIVAFGWCSASSACSSRCRCWW